MNGRPLMWHQDIQGITSGIALKLHIPTAVWFPEPGREAQLDGCGHVGIGQATFSAPSL